MHTSVYPYRSTTAAIMLSPRESRIVAEHRKMQRNAAALIAADPRLIDFGPDPLVDQLLSAAGFDARQAFSKRLCIARQGVWDTSRACSRTLIIVSSRVWHSELDRMQLQEVKQDARQHHVDCMLVPQRALAGPLRLSTAKTIVHSRHVRCSASDRLRIIGHLQAAGGSSDLEDCCTQLSHSDPAGVILALVARGDLRVDRSKPIGPHSRIDCII